MKHIIRALLEQIAEIDQLSDFDHACSDVDIYFDRGKITWEDHELCYKLIGKIGKLKGFCV